MRRHHINLDLARLDQEPSPDLKRGVLAAAMGLSSALLLRESMPSLPQHSGAARLVIDHDAIVYRKSYGLVDLKTQRPITADSSLLD
jgi:hypothetical protein